MNIYNYKNLDQTVSTSFATHLVQLEILKLSCLSIATTWLQRLPPSMTSQGLTTRPGTFLICRFRIRWSSVCRCAVLSMEPKWVSIRETCLKSLMTCRPSNPTYSAASLASTLGSTTRSWQALRKSLLFSSGCLTELLTANFTICNIKVLFIINFMIMWFSERYETFWEVKLS